MQENVVVVGAGMGGLVAACMLARAGAKVLLLEAAGQVGGKAHRVQVGGRWLDMGPSVLTLRQAFDDVFAACGERLEDAVTLHTLPQLARHAWTPGVPGAPPAAKGDGPPTVLDLFAEESRSVDAIGSVFGAKAAREYAAFARYSEKLYAAAAQTFIFGAKPSLLTAARSFGVRVFTAAWEMDARRSMAQALAASFPTTPALQQLFGRYATYCGASPLQAPATLNLIAHVERQGVWSVAGGISALAVALGQLAERQGAVVRCDAPVRHLRRTGGRITAVELVDGEVIEAGAVVFAGDLRAFESGRLWRSPEADAAEARPVAEGLSAEVCGLLAHAEPDAGFAPAVHNVVFTGTSRDEFTDLFDRGVRPRRPTVYICAPDRAPGVQEPASAASGELATATTAAASAVTGQSTPTPRHGGGPAAAEDAQAERFFCLLNAPPGRAERSFEEQVQWQQAWMQQLASSGLVLRPTHAPVFADPNDFARRFPGSDGALYGHPPHSWRSFFTRPGSHTRLSNTFCAGGSVHPGPGVPMAALSGARAAEALLAAFPSIVRSGLAVTPGGTSTPRATTAPIS